MPLKMRPTGLGHGVYKDNVDYSVFCGEWCIGRIYDTRTGLEHLRWFLRCTFAAGRRTCAPTIAEGVGQAGRGALEEWPPREKAPPKRGQVGMFAILATGRLAASAGERIVGPNRGSGAPQYRLKRQGDRHATSGRD